MSDLTLQYRGYNIDIYQDLGAPNPWEDWDGQPPILVALCGEGDTHAYGTDWDLPTLNGAQVLQHARDIALELGYDSLIKVLADHVQGCGDREEPLDDLINDALSEYYAGLNDADKLGLLESACGWVGIETYRTTSHGYCQGHQADLLLIATPEWLKETGIKAEHVQSQLEAAAELYGHWAWGDVYGYEVTHPETGEQIGSCWGFYGNDPGASGLLEHAHDDIACHISEERKQHLAKVRDWITHRVPLEARVSWN